MARVRQPRTPHRAIITTNRKTTSLPQTAYSEPQTQPYSNPMQDVVNQSQNVVHTYEADVKNAGKSTPEIDLDDLSDFQTILGDGDVPF